MDINNIRIVRDGIDGKKSKESKTQVKRIKTKNDIVHGCLKLSDYMIF